MIERKFVDLYARSAKVPLDIAERDVVLTYVLKILSKDLLAKLVFKGGTCLKKLFFGNSGRFSMDLDFTSLNISVDELTKEIRKRIDNVEAYGLNFRIKEENIREGFDSGDVSYLADVSYTHEWNSSEFMIEVSYREKPILSPDQNRPLLKEMYFKYLEFPVFTVNCLQKEELLAEKIRAAFQRIRSRDLYDMYLFCEKKIDATKLRKLVVLKFWNVREPFNPNLLFEKLSGTDYNWDDLEQLVRKNNLPSKETILRKVLANYSFLKDLDQDLMRIVKDSKAHKEQDFANRLERTIV